MKGVGIDRKRLKEYALVSVAYLLISMAFFWPLLANITATVPGSGGDVFQGLWELWWVPYSLFTLHASPYITHLIFYPVGANLSTQTFAPVAGIVSALFQGVGVAFSLNVIFFIGFVLAGFFAYLLAFHLTKNRAASFLAGFIFAFSPIHIVQSFGHLQYINIGFIPLFLLLFIKMFEDGRHSDAILAGVSFVLLAFMGDIEQALMTMVIAFLIIAYMLLRKGSRGLLLNRRFAMLFAEMVAVALALGSPAILAIAGSRQPGTLSAVNSQAGVSYNELYSPDLLSFFIPSQMNGLLGFASGAAASINAPAQAERTVYAGYTVLALALIGLFYSFKEKLKHTGIIVVPLAFLALLSIGPYLQVGGTVTALPGIYLLYHQIPLFNVLREPGRFDIAVELFLALLAAFGFAKVEHALSGQGRPLAKNAKTLAFSAFVLLLVLEYNPWPLSQGALNGSYTNAQIPRAYVELGGINANFSVMVLPALSNYSSVAPELYPGMAMYYQTAFRKPLVGGYTTRYNASQIFSLADMPLADSASYLESGQGLIYALPDSRELHERNAAAHGGLQRGVRLGRPAGIQPDAARAHHELPRERLRSAGRTTTTAPPLSSPPPTPYPRPPGRAPSPTPLCSWEALTACGSRAGMLCGSSPLCNSTVDGTWFAADPAYINIYSPRYSRIGMSMRALSPDGPKTAGGVFRQPAARTRST